MKNHPPKHYVGNYPNSRNFDDNLPIGYNKWDLGEVWSPDDEDEEPEDDLPDEIETDNEEWY